MPEDPNQGTRNTEEEDEQTPENAAYQGTAGTDIIVGSEEDDSVSSNAGVDIIMGGSGDDTLRGQGDADVIRGGSGADTIEGGAGADTFVFGRGHGSDTITDFDTDEDTINLSAFGADLSYSDLTITATTDGTGTIITVPGEDGENNGITITLEGVTSTDVTADIFEFLAVDDTLTGTTADEIITGAYGDDTMTGGGGSDTFVFAPGDGDDTVTDFSTADDKIDLTAFGRDVSFDDLTIATTTGRSSRCRGMTAARSRCRA